MNASSRATWRVTARDSRGPSVYELEHGSLTLAVHRVSGSEGWWLTCDCLGIRGRPIPKDARGTTMREKALGLLRRRLDDYAAALQAAEAATAPPEDHTPPPAARGAP